MTALQHAGWCAQQDRIALNKSHKHLNELQVDYNIVETIRARCENDLHEKRQKHEACKETLDQKQRHHNDTKKDLNCVWNAHNRLREIISKHSDQMTIEIEHGLHLKIADLILELKAKAIKISCLESFLMQVRDDIEELNAKHDVKTTRHAKEKIELIGQLQSIFHSDQSIAITLSSKRKKSKKFSWRERLKTQEKLSFDDIKRSERDDLKMENYIKMKEI